MMIVTYIVHDRGGKPGNDVTITVRSDGGPDERDVFQMMARHTAGFTVALPHYVASDGITVVEVRQE